MWGSQGIKDKDTHKGNYYYSPGPNDQAAAIKIASEEKITGSTPKTMGVLRLDPHTRAEIDKGALTLIATIPEGDIILRPHPATRTARGKLSTTSQYGIILGIHPNHKTLDKKEILTAIYTIKHLKKTLYPRATINEQAIYEEVTGQKGKCPYTENDWHGIITQAWKWIDSPTGTQGLVYKEDQTEVETLKGSRKYAKKTRQVALKLFTFFAQDWEDKNNLLPPYARKWWNQKEYEPKEESPTLKRKTAEELQEQQTHWKRLRTEAFSVRQSIHKSATCLTQAWQSLFPKTQAPAPVELHTSTATCEQGQIATQPEHSLPLTSLPRHTTLSSTFLGISRSLTRIVTRLQDNYQAPHIQDAQPPSTQKPIELPATESWMCQWCSNQSNPD
jgi:hypothetical protein